MPTEKKRQTVEELKERFARATMAVATGYQGLPVSAMDEARQKLRERGVEYRVVKNTLALMAAEEAGRPAIKEIIRGPTAMALGYDDPVAVAKALDEVIHGARINLQLLGGVMDGTVLSPGELTRLATLPPREHLLAQLLGGLQAPIARLVATLNAPLAGLAVVLQQRVRQMEQGGGGKGAAAPSAP